MKSVVILAGLVLLAAGCNRCPPPFEPKICFTAPQPLITGLPTPFPSLEKEELQTLWGKELYLGVHFAEEGDWYRAITAFKSSQFLLPKKLTARKQQIEFYLFLSYYFGCKYKEALQVYENSSLIFLGESFLPVRELNLALWDCYNKTHQPEKAEKIQLDFPVDERADLSLSRALQKGDLPLLQEFSDRPDIDNLLSHYYTERKSPERAKTLQALLPGAGYYYVGQEKAAVTSLIINTLFIAAALEFWHRGYYAASLITFSLETGWYFGGINGAGLAANEFNERLYEGLGKETLIKERYFPVLRFEYAF